MKIGANEVVEVEPGFTFIRYAEVVGGEEAMMVMDALESNIGEDSFHRVEADMTQLTGATPEARRITADRLRQMPALGVAIVSDSFTQRMIAKLVLTAVSMLGGSTDLETGYFKTRDEARAWLREYAAKKNAESSSG